MNAALEMEVAMFNQEEGEDIKRFLKKQTEYFRANPAAARAFLLSTGTYTADEQLAPEFRADDPEEVDPPPPR